MIRKPSGSDPKPIAAPQIQKSAKKAETPSILQNAQQFGDNFEVQGPKGPVFIPEPATEQRTLKLPPGTVFEVPEQLATLQGVTEIAGDLIITANVSDKELSALLPSLQFVSGKIDVKSAPSFEGRLKNSQLAVAKQAKALAASVKFLGSIDLANIKPAKIGYLTYLNGDNNLDPYGLKDLIEMKQVGSAEGKVNAFVLVDTAGSYNASTEWPKQAKLFYVVKDGVLEVQVPPETKLGQFLAKGEVNMGDAELMDAFLAFTQGGCPSEHVIFNGWDHGGGRAGVIFDDNPNDHLDMEGGELEKGLQSVKPGVVMWDCCLEQNWETNLHLAASGIPFVVASEELAPGNGRDYVKDMNALIAIADKPELSDEMVAKTLVDAYLGETERSTNSYIELNKKQLDPTSKSQLQELTDKMNALGTVLVQGGGLKNKDIMACYRAAKRFSGEHMSVGDFARRLAEAFPEGPLKAAAADMKASFDKIYKVTADPAQYSTASGMQCAAPMYRVPTTWKNPAAPWANMEWTKFILTLEAKDDPSFVIPAWAQATNPPPTPTPTPTPTPMPDYDYD